MREFSFCTSTVRDSQWDPSGPSLKVSSLENNNRLFKKWALLNGCAAVWRRHLRLGELPRLTFICKFVITTSSVTEPWKSVKRCDSCCWRTRRVNGCINQTCDCKGTVSPTFKPEAPRSPLELPSEGLSGLRKEKKQAMSLTDDLNSRGSGSGWRS